MWWGGFSEAWHSLHFESHRWVLIPMWWGGFSEGVICQQNHKDSRLNPHVVGRFFRGNAVSNSALKLLVLIPMWWGGFSESGGVFSLLNSAG